MFVGLWPNKKVEVPVNDLKNLSKAFDTNDVSWEFRDSSHGLAYRRGSTMVMMGLAWDHAN
jgi:hypothetical protein